MDFQNRPGAKTGGGGAATQGMADRWSFFVSFESQFWLASSFHLELSFFPGRGERGWLLWLQRPSTWRRCPIKPASIIQ